MARIIDVVRRMLPAGSVFGAGRSVRTCPFWPPDLFAIAATLVEANGVYAHPCFTNGWQAGKYTFNAAYVGEVQGLGQQWAASPLNPPRDGKRWRYGRNRATWRRSWISRPATMPSSFRSHAVERPRNARERR